MNKNKGYIQILLIAGIMVVAGIIAWLVYSSPKKSEVAKNPAPVPTAYQQDYASGTDEVPPIDDSADFQTVSASLDTASTQEFDTELQKFDEDMGSF